jgi:hypothetical protein
MKAADAALDLVALSAASNGRMGRVLEYLGAKVHGSEARGRSSCPPHGGDGLNTMYGDRVATCFSGCDTTGKGQSRDALQIVADCRGWNLRDRDDLRKAAEELAEILGVRLEDPRPASHTIPPAHRPTPRPSRNVEALWRCLAARDETGESYLDGRRLGSFPFPEGVVRFNVGMSGDSWLDERATEGYRCSFAGRRPDGTVATIVSRHVGPGIPPETFKKAPTLPGCSTAGVAIVRPELALLETGDPEFMRDEVAVVEGPTDWLAATRAFDLAAIEQKAPQVWALGAIGAANAAGVVAAFAPMIRGRVVHVGLDTDPAGEKSVPAVVAAAWKAGASRVTRLIPYGKDLAEALEAIS